MVILKYICLLIAIVYTFSNLGKLTRKSLPISSFQIWIMAISIVGYVLLEFQLGY